MNWDRGGARNAPRTMSLSELLRRHLRYGTRPGGTPGVLGKSWTNKEFADAVGMPVDTVRRWSSGENCPNYTTPIEDALFGSNPDYEPDRRELRDAHEAAQSGSRTSMVPEIIPPAVSSVAVFPRLLDQLFSYRTFLKEDATVIISGRPHFPARAWPNPVRLVIGPPPWCASRKADGPCQGSADGPGDR
jgi:hypothetical protein